MFRLRAYALACCITDGLTRRLLIIRHLRFYSLNYGLFGVLSLLQKVNLLFSVI